MQAGVAGGPAARCASMRSRQVEVEPERIATMSRRSLIRAIGAVDCGFPLDFTPEYLTSLNLDKLRHLYLALCLRARCRQQETVQQSAGG
jgi:hypothetical protein